MKLSRKLMMLLAVLLSFSLVAAACGDDDDDTADAGSDDAADTGSDDYLGDGSLGTVVVEPGAQVQIRSLNAISGDVAFLGVPNQRGVEAAVADFGDIKGFEVTSGEGLDDLCSAEGGQAAAQQIVADEQVVGVISTSCSGAAASAAPLISDAGLVMISGSNTSPSRQVRRAIRALASTGRHDALTAARPGRGRSGQPTRLRLAAAGQGSEKHQLRTNQRSVQLLRIMIVL